MVAPEDVEKMLRDEVIKRETMEGPQADAAVRRVTKRSDRSIIKERPAETVDSGILSADVAATLPAAAPPPA